MIAGLAADLGLKILDQIGGVALSNLIEKIRNRPTFSRDSSQYFSNLKLNLENELKRSEDQLQTIVSTAMNNNNMEYYDKLERLRSRIAIVRYDVEKTGSNKYLEITPDATILRAITILNLSLVFEISVLQSLMNNTIEKVEDGEDIQFDYKRMRSSVSVIEEIKAHLDKAAITPEASEKAVMDLQQKKHVFSEIFGEFTEESVKRAEIMLASVVLSKPDSFTKVEYIQHLAFQIKHYIENLNLKSSDLDDLKDGLERENAKAKISDDDMEKAVRIIISSDKRFVLRTEDKNMSLEFAAITK
ncbi:MAG: hypothetical protein GPJ54_20810 [Candidatus Heimdallarchaeota archaeon]|nr:hypothetical protein [Candidatus Heimdallarchaeota archaeon]